MICIGTICVTRSARGWRAGCSEATIAELMGHSDPQTTRRYTHATDRAKRTAVEAVRVLRDRICHNVRTAAKVGSRNWLMKTGRDGEIRTRDLTHPKRARYQAAPRPVSLDLVSCERTKVKPRRKNLLTSRVPYFPARAATTIRVTRKQVA